MFKVKVVFIPDNAESSTCAHRCGLFSSSNPRFQFQVTPQEIWAIMCGVVAAWWWILLSIHIVWIPGASTDSTTAQQLVWCPAAIQDFNQLPQSVPTAAVEAAWWWVVLPILIISRLSNTLLMFEIDVRTMQCGSAASIAGQWYGLMHRSNSGFQLHSQILVIMCGGNSAWRRIHLSIHTIWML